jgi:hypothetical protein
MYIDTRYALLMILKRLPPREEEIVRRLFFTGESRADCKFGNSVSEF